MEAYRVFMGSDNCSTGHREKQQWVAAMEALWNLTSEIQLDVVQLEATSATAVTIPHHTASDTMPWWITICWCAARRHKTLRSATAAVVRSQPSHMLGALHLKSVKPVPLLFIYDNTKILKLASCTGYHSGNYRLHSQQFVDLVP